MRVKDVQKLRKVVILRGLGYSQEEISERTDVSQQALSRWFRELKEDAEEMGSIKLMPASLGLSTPNTGT